MYFWPPNCRDCYYSLGLVCTCRNIVSKSCVQITYISLHFESFRSQLLGFSREHLWWGKFFCELTNISSGLSMWGAGGLENPPDLRGDAFWQTQSHANFNTRVSGCHSCRSPLMRLVTSVTMTSPSKPFQMTWLRASLNPSFPDLAGGELVGKVSSEHNRLRLCLFTAFCKSPRVTYFGYTSEQGRCKTELTSARGKQIHT